MSAALLVIGGDKADACTWKLIVRNFDSQLLDENQPFGSA
jgi:hypothetical protein